METIQDWNSKREIADRIFVLRKSNDLDSAIKLIKEAAVKFPADYFFPKIEGDLYFQKEEYDAAAVSWVEFLKNIPSTPAPRSFGEFAKRYYRLKKVFTKKKAEKFALKILEEINRKNIVGPIANRCLSLIKDDLTEISDKSNMDFFVDWLNDDKTFNKCVRTIRGLESSNPIKIELLIDKHVLNRPRGANTFRIDTYCVAFYERIERFENAIKIAEELLTVKLDSVVLRSLFRNCRRQGDFDKIESVLTQYPNIIKGMGSDFNILYELVYYFEARNQFDEVKTILLQIERTGMNSAPIQKTVKNFYIRFGLKEEAKRVSENIAKLEGFKEKKNRFADEVSESEAGVFSTVKDLHSKLEHSRQLAAISDLTTGISHELGQPITNIRYTIQFYRRFLKEPISKGQVNKIFESILEETRRMGGLIKRLSPMTSTKSLIERFDIMERIKIRVKAEEARLSRMENIKIRISPSYKPIYFLGDPVKFEQLITNLLLNAIDGINEKKPRNKTIVINVTETETDVHIKFSDNGIGIPFKYSSKIFDPFFSTKAPGKGEGLGLFIIWNIVKYMGGTISLDSTFKRGARFLLAIPKRQKGNKET